MEVGVEAGVEVGMEVGVEVGVEATGCVQLASAMAIITTARLLRLPTTLQAKRTRITGRYTLIAILPGPKPV